MLCVSSYCGMCSHMHVNHDPALSYFVHLDSLAHGLRNETCINRASYNVPGRV